MKPNPFDQITTRERDVARSLAIGWNNHEIAKHLGISVKTVDTHRHKALVKTGCRNNVELARLAIAVGLVTIPVFDPDACVTG